MTWTAKIAGLTAAVVMGMGVFGTAKAGDYNGNFMIRLQGTELVTRDNVTSLTRTSDGANLKALGYDAKVSDEFLPTATLTYFFNKNLAVELFCCFATADVDLKLNGATVGQVAKTWMFPPALTLQYHFDKIGAFKPYVGAGFQWIHYFDSKTGDNKLGQVSASFDDSFGAIVQAGVDVELGRGWYANFDVKKSWLDTKVTWVGSPGYSAKVDIDPLIVSAGVGYRFNLSDIFGARTATTASLK